MDATMTVESPAAYEQWLASQMPYELNSSRRIKAIVFSVKEWVTTTHHKQIGILYIVTAIFFMAIAGMFGEMMRTQLAVPMNTFLDAFTYEQTVTLAWTFNDTLGSHTSWRRNSKLHCAAPDRRKGLWRSRA